MGFDRNLDLQFASPCLGDGLTQDRGVIVEEQSLEVFVWNREMNSALIAAVEDDRPKPRVKALPIDAPRDF
jgi:hypothetical protein